MDLRRLRAGEWIAGASGLILFVSLFLPWYQVESRVPASGPFRERLERDLPLDISAFEAFSVFDVLLVLVATAGIALLVVTAVQEAPAVGIAVDALVTLVAGVFAILLLFRVLNVPGDLEVAAGQPFETGTAAAAWIGLAAAFGVFAGSLVAMRDERRSEPGRPTDPTGVPVDAHPEVETLPSP